MAFGEGFKHVDSNEFLEPGIYDAKIVKAEIKEGKFGNYIQAEVSVMNHPNCNPHIFLMNDRPKEGFGSMTREQAQEMWDRNMTKFFQNFNIQEGDFDMFHWCGKSGQVTVRPQKKNPQYNELVPYVVKITQKVETPAAKPAEDVPFPEDTADIF